MNESGCKDAIEKRVSDTLNRIKVLQCGGKIKCPACKDGYIEAVGNPATARFFTCKCGLHFFLDK